MVDKQFIGAMANEIADIASILLKLMNEARANGDENKVKVCQCMLSGVELSMDAVLGVWDKYSKLKRGDADANHHRTS